MHYAGLRAAAVQYYEIKVKVNHFQHICTGDVTCDRYKIVKINL